MHFRLKRLKHWYFKLLLEVLTDFFQLAESVNRIGLLRPWLLPDRRKTNKTVMQNRRFLPITPFGLALWLVAFYIVGVIIWGDARQGIIMAISYGVLISSYIFMRLGKLLRRNLLAYERS